jgi:hypothetical protein
MISAARVPSCTIATAAARLFEIWAVAAEPAQAGLGVGDGGGDRLIHFVRQGGGQLRHRGHPVDAREIGARLAQRFLGALALEQGGDRREGQNGERHARHPQRQIGLIETCVGLRPSSGPLNRSVSGEDGRSHPGVVHAGNGEAHHQGGDELLPKLRGPERQPQGRRRRADRDDHGERNENSFVAERGVPPHCRHADVMHGDDAKPHDDAAENEVKRRCALLADDVKAAAGHQDRDRERKGGQSDVVGHRYRHAEGEHGDEVHRPYSAPHRDRGRREPRATRKSAGVPHVPAEIERGVGRHTGDQNGQRDEIRIVRSGNDHRDCPNFRTRDLPGTRPPTLSASAAGNVTGAPPKADVDRHSEMTWFPSVQDAPLALCWQDRERMTPGLPPQEQ